jgi:opacity protein-like surface antigen
MNMKTFNKEFIMIKKVKTISLAVILSSLLYADNYSVGKKFVGLEVGGAEIQGGVYPDLNNIFVFDPLYTSTDVTYGLRFGAQNDEYRTMLLFDYYDNVDDDQNLQLGLVTVDYYVLSQDAAAVTIKPFVGINLGYLRYQSTLVDETTFAYGGQAGIVASISENIDIDLAYRYTLGQNAPTMDHFGAAMLGLNYIY